MEGSSQDPKIQPNDGSYVRHLREYMLVWLQGDKNRIIDLSTYDAEAAVMIDRDIPADFPWRGPLRIYTHLPNRILFLTDGRGNAWYWSGTAWMEESYSVPG